MFSEYEASNVVLRYKAPSYYNEKVSCHYKRHTQVLTLDLRGETNGRETVFAKVRMVWEAEGHLKVTATKGEELERIVESPRSSMRRGSLDQYRSSVRVNGTTQLELP